MLWVVIDKGSYQIISCNIFKRDGKIQLWAERPNGKSIKLMESEDKNEVELAKEAIDHCIKVGTPSLELV